MPGFGGNDPQAASGRARPGQPSRPAGDGSRFPLKVSIADTEPAFRDLAESWNRLARHCAHRVFFRHEWFDAAWAWRREDASLFVLLAWEDEDLVGILPLVRVRAGGHLPALRRLEFLAVPDTQFCDLIAAPENRSRAAEAFCAELHRRRDQWDRLVLKYLDGNAAALSGIGTGLAARRYACRVGAQGRNLFVALEPSWESYYGTRSRSLKKANNLAANRLKKTGEIGVRWVTPGNCGEPAVRGALQQAIDISRRSWKRDTGNSLDRPGPGAFIETLTAHAARHGWLSLWLLCVDGEPLAMEYQLLDGGNVYALRADFDAAREEISPGSHLMRTLLESLFGKGLKRYYMGPGENPYKTRWTEDGDPLHQMVVHGRTWRGRLMRAFDDGVKPFARWLRDGFASRKAQPREQAAKP